MVGVSEETLRLYRESQKPVKIGKVVSDETMRLYEEEQTMLQEPLRMGFRHWGEDARDDEIARLKKRIKELERR